MPWIGIALYSTTETEWNLSCALALATCSRLGLLGRLPAWPERTVSACRFGRRSLATGLALTPKLKE